MGVAAALSAKLVAHLPARLVAGPGLLVAAAGMLWFATLDPDSSYTTHLLSAMFVTALGLGMCFVPMTLGAVTGVADQQTGIASALLNTAQQIGGALGLAVLSTIATATADDKLPDAARSLYRGLATNDFALVQRAGAALTHGYTMAFAAAAIMFLAALAVTMTTINARRQRHSEGTAAVHLG